MLVGIVGHPLVVEAIRSSMFVGPEPTPAEVESHALALDLVRWWLAESPGRADLPLAHYEVNAALATWL